MCVAIVEIATRALGSCLGYLGADRQRNHDGLARRRTAGIAANVMAEISERFVLNLKAPIGRVSGPDSIFPFAQAENDWAVKAEDIVNKVKEVVDYD